MSSRDLPQSLSSVLNASRTTDSRDARDTAQRLQFVEVVLGEKLAHAAPARFTHATLACYE